MPSAHRLRPGREIHLIMDINHILSSPQPPPPSTTLSPRSIPHEPKSPSTIPSPSLTTPDIPIFSSPSSPLPSQPSPHPNPFEFAFIHCSPITSFPSPSPFPPTPSSLTFIHCTPSARVKGKRKFTFWTETRDDGSAPVVVSHRNFGNHTVDAKGRVMRGIGCQDLGWDVEKGLVVGARWRAWRPGSGMGRKRKEQGKGVGKVNVEEGVGKGEGEGEEKEEWTVNKELRWLELTWIEEVFE